MKHLSGEPTNNAIVHLLFVNQPSDMLVQGIPISNGEEPSPPQWNLVADKDVIPWYTALFTFVEAYLEDNGGMVVFMPCGLSYELHKLAQKAGFEVKTEWICNQSEPFVHPNFPNMMVSF